ncbi:MAG TPA: hypothetical protein PK402_06645, partial [Tepidisphaeraceae bacterium]|nr:hypothetical protein [Tepidisphaeraceae bacterium]
MFGKLISSASLRACVLTAVAAVGVTGSIAGAGTYTVIPVDPAGPNPWLGFMNVFELDNTTYAFGSPWGTADLTAEFTGPVLTLGPNSIGDPDPYWYIGGGGPGAQGNKMMHASMYREMGAVEAGQNLTFQGTVLADTFAQGYDVTVFIK